MAAGKLYLDNDGDVWEETSPGMVVCRYEDFSEWGNEGSPSSFETASEYHGPLVLLVPTSPDLDPERLEKTLRAYVSELDYDIHKGIESGEEDEADHYPEEVQFFLRCWDEAGS